MLLSNRTYETGKKLVQVILPACGALYFGLGKVWGLPAAEEVVGTLALLATFLGVVLGISSSQYQELKQLDAPPAGTLVVKTTPKTKKKTFSLEVDMDPYEIEKFASVSFNIVREENTA